MEGASKVVVLVSKSLIRAAKVEADQIVDPIEMEWQPDVLRKAFSVVKERYHSSRIRLVLDEDMSHTLDIEIPAATERESEKDVIAAKLKIQIPDVLTAGDWDYKLKETKDDVKVMTVFVPVQDVFLDLTEAAAKEGITIEAVEPISLSLTRDPNPFVGMAKKTDLRGDDQEVLNIQPLYKMEETTGALESFTPPASPKKLNKILIIAAGVALFGLLAFGVIAVVKRTGTPAPSPSPSPVATVTPSPSPVPSPLAIDELKVNILNGSGVPGEAGVVAAKLSKAGFGKADTGNAESYNFTDTIVELKSTASDAAYTAIVKALQPDYTVKKGSALDEDSEYDVVVTVGKKTSSAATPRPSPRPSASPAASTTASPSPSPSASPTVSPSPSPSPSPTVSPSPSAST